MTQLRPPPCRVPPERYLSLLEELCAAAAVLQPRPDCVLGIKRSGLFPAVVLSHQLELPCLTASEAKHFPYPRLQWPLIVDTVAWTGETIRRCQQRLARCGVPEERLRVLVMFARAVPLPPVSQLSWLETSAAIPRFWYQQG